MTLESLKLGFVVAGKYVVERELGRGGMGVVYVVSHATTGKRMAMKCLLPQLVHDAELVGRFMREAKVLGRFNHRHVVDVFDVGRDGDVLYIVMELLEGRVLSDLLGDASMTLDEALLIITRAMEGVAAAHEHGVIHRDLKPDNIFVCEGATGRLDDPRVLDFGISRLDETNGPQLTRTGVAIGTPYYMAYEQLGGQRDLDARADVYAMGVILYEAIAGTPPYVGSSLSAVAVRMLTSEPDDLAALRPDLPPKLAAIVMKAISRTRDARQPDMRTLIDELRPYLSLGGVANATGRASLPLRVPRARSLPDESPVLAESAIRARRGSGESGGAPAPGGVVAPQRFGRFALASACGAVLLTLGSGAWYLKRAQPAEVPRIDAAPVGLRLPQPTPQPSGPAPLPEKAATPPAQAAAVVPQVSPAIAPDAGATPRAPVPTPSAATAAPPRARWMRWQPRAPAGATGIASRPTSDAGVGSVAKPAPEATPHGGAPSTSAPVPPAQPTNAPGEPRRVEGRAGKLGASEF